MVLKYSCMTRRQRDTTSSEWAFQLFNFELLDAYISYIRVQYIIQVVKSIRILEHDITFKAKSHN